MNSNLNVATKTILNIKIRAVRMFKSFWISLKVTSKT